MHIKLLLMKWIDMNWKIKLLIPLLFIIGCGNNPMVFGTYTVAPEFAPYVNQFAGELYKRKVVHNPYLSVAFGPLTGITVGSCMHWADMRMTPIITIDRTFWNQSTDDIKTEVIFHELGHCWLNIQHHDDNLLASGWPESIMNTNVFDGTQFTINYDYYVNQEIGLAGN